MMSKKPKRGSGGIEIDGIISISRRGVGYIVHNTYKNDIEIEFENLNTALHGDHVCVKILSGKNSESPEGKVVRVISRAKKTHVGTIKKDGGVFLIDPQDNRTYIDIIIPDKKRNGAKPNQKVVVRIIRWENPNENPLGEVIEVIGESGEHETEIRAIVLDKGLSLSFPKDVEEEAQNIKLAYAKHFKEEVLKRRDFRNIPTCTIDPDTAKDFDDALSVQKLSNGNYEIGIHIADVTFFVKPGSALEKEAANRTTSVYLVDRTIPMLPEILSNDLCSLNPNEDKFSFSAVFEFTKEGVIKNSWFGRTVIRSQKRFTYKEAQNVLDTKQGPFADELAVLSIIAKKLRAERARKGALAFDNPEVVIELDSKGHPIRISTKERLETNYLIEDFMILANREVAKFAEGHDKNIKRTFVYRVHDVPQAEKIEELTKLLKILGYNVPKKQPKSAEEISALLFQVKDESHTHIVNMATIQAMQRAIYSMKNIGHFGLSLKHYTHFTSPIRRYPDMMVHRFLDVYLKGKTLPDKQLEEYEALTRYTTAMERTADEAQWASTKFKQVEYMADRIGNTYEGIITGMLEKGMFVREEETLTEGMVRLRDLKDDYYVYDKEKKCVLGERKKRKFTIGDSVKIKVLRVDVGRRLIDFGISNTDTTKRTRG